MFIAFFGGIKRENEKKNEIMHVIVFMLWSSSKTCIINILVIED